ncbi:Por secretion system C-terminal sorting domain-containing protein [Flexibacter flexilis DSM 6793]|uniref:Por secretion system C-terminal sorting domain-containing protein n=1 Tax=Flexibacter flexilis DSM 6793 TaxID=927664 RepID=A0A1I1HQH0_9BACT|nr:S8/S53 family peptidase [Flexibacter flexilis]SFC26101.1 Por secretion system C-terminal sorting domain-containing protein [Flexibacter flexilis DSM 6793]
MKNYYSYALALLLAGAVSTNTVAGNGTGASAYAKPSKQYTIPKGSEYLHDRVVIRVHDSYRAACGKNSINVAALERTLSNLGGVIRKKFPHNQAPAANARNREGKRLVDLSLIYEVRFSSPINVQSAIDDLLATGTLVNAEPHFIFAPSYTPNDANISSQNGYLNVIKAKEAWESQKGDSTVTIAIVDSGVRWDHPDLIGNIQYNTADPIDGIDNDNDGYVDNYRGWDLGGSDYNLDTLAEDNNPTVTGDNNGHGTHVAGLAAAHTDNATGIAGTGFKCRILPIKCAADNDTRGPGGVGYVLTGYEGIIYAADHGAQVINCSWGGAGTADGIIQQVIDYAIINKGSVVVAAAGNNNVQTDFVPAYADGVISVAATQNNDRKASFSNYSYKVSVSAPGNNIYSTLWNNSYGTMSGTSMASPITAGAVGVICAKYPNYTPAQVKALLRSTCDDIYSVTGNATYRDKLGKGRINMYRAVTESNPALKYVTLGIADEDNNITAGDTVKLGGSFINLLNPSTNMTVTLSTTSTAYVTVLNPTITLGAMATNETKALSNNGFDVVINPSTPLNTTLNFKLTYADGTYTDFEYFAAVVNQDYVNIGVNNITTTAGSWGHLGFMDSDASIGMGFQYKKTNMIYEMSLIAGVATDSISNCARGAVASGAWDEDFSNISRATATIPSTVSAYDVVAKFNDDGTSATAPLNIEITQNTHAWTTIADSNYVMVVYDIKNNSNNNYYNFYLGLYADFDVSDGGTLDKAKWSAAKRMGYVQNTETNGLFAGIVSLNTNALPHHYAFKNDGTDGGLGVYNGFTDSEKFQTISGAVSKDTAGVADISQTVGSGPYTLAAGQTIQVAFALVGGENLPMIESAADAAITKYNSLVATRKPTANTIAVNVWPNPAQNVLNIQVPAAGATTVQLYDGLGRQVYNNNTDNTSIRLNLEKYAHGVYTLKVQNKDGISVQKVAIK